ncbi:hypothetical protein THASP1DRAFT_28720 [Thamnocephalis sphaerospora]|uniref:F-box domain-containing protein n=1 Tax=Thamnocephalis sphaerospora TaxID=78915 RepID=A0A4P9XTL8_9FUNG|nr:hypothetical protein THASP1DRAFT_28720 [Thamnocephalis sphaerospora]|eukprot:RKP09496.1 hypothetical protein THASP1DRAFT_28720 [Thamnocephalis sphaerospora]
MNSPAAIVTTPEMLDVRQTAVENDRALASHRGQPLPEELLFCVLVRLDETDLRTMLHASRQLRRLARDTLLWRYIRRIRVPYQLAALLTRPSRPDRATLAQRNILRGLALDQGIRDGRYIGSIAQRSAYDAQQRIVSNMTRLHLKLRLRRRPSLQTLRERNLVPAEMATLHPMLQPDPMQLGQSGGETCKLEGSFETANAPSRLLSTGDVARQARPATPPTALPPSSASSPLPPSTLPTSTAPIGRANASPSKLVAAELVGNTAEPPTGVISPDQCSSQSYTIDNFMILGCTNLRSERPWCHMDANATSTAPSPSPDAPIVPTTKGSMWRGCKESADIVYQAKDPSGRLVQCDPFTPLLNTDWDVQGCYALTRDRPNAPLQCMSNGRLLRCTGVRKMLDAPVIPEDGSDDGSSERIGAPNTPGTTEASENTSTVEAKSVQGISTGARAGMIAGIILAGAGVLGFASVLIRRRVVEQRAQRERKRRFTNFGMPN